MPFSNNARLTAQAEKRKIHVADDERRAAKKALIEEAGERRAVVTSDAADAADAADAPDAADAADAPDEGDDPNLVSAANAVSPFLGLLTNVDFISKIKDSVTPTLKILFDNVDRESLDGTFKLSTYKKIVSEIDNNIMRDFDDDDASTPSIFMGTLLTRAKAAVDGLKDIKMKIDIENIKAKGTERYSAGWGDPRALYANAGA